MTAILMPVAAKSKRVLTSG